MTPDFRAIFNSASCLFLVALPDPPRFTIVAASDAYLQATLTVREEILGRGVFEVFPESPEDSGAESAVRESFTRAASGQPDTLPVQKYDVRRPDGTWALRYWLPHNSPVFIDGKVAYVLHRVEDVTVSDEPAKLVGLAHDLLVVADFTGRCLSANPAVTRLLGWTVEEILAAPYFSLIHPDDLPRTVAEVQRMAEGVTSLHFANRYRHKDGSYRWIAWTSVPAGDRMYAVGRDVTIEREQADALAAAVEELSAFSASVSHDLRAPLRAIAGYAALLGQAGLGYDELVWVERIRRTAERADEVVVDLLALAQISQGEIERRPVGLTALARSVAAELRLRDPLHRVAVRIADGLTAVGDARLLRVLLENLLSNSFKFTGGTDEPTIEVGSEGGAFFVRDNGVGFAERDAHRLFQPFVRLHGDAAFPGTGIGLATCKRIVTRHGGRIWAEARPGEGACFRWTIGA